MQRFGKLHSPTNRGLPEGQFKLQRFGKLHSPTNLWTTFLEGRRPKTVIDFVFFSNQKWTIHGYIFSLRRGPATTRPSHARVPHSLTPPLSLGIPASPLLRGAPRRPPPAEVCTRVPWQPWRQASARQCRPPPPFPGDERSPLRSHAPRRHAHVTHCDPPSLGIPASPLLQEAPKPAAGR